MKRFLIGLVIFLVVLVGLGYFLIRYLNYFPADKENVIIVCKQPPKLKKGMKLRLLSWNIQYGASRKYHFFYDGGKAVYSTKKDVEKTLKAISDVIKEVKPDVILWQEVDRHSRRTSFIDEAKWLLKAHPEFKCWTSTPYHKSSYIPAPSHQHLKQVQMDLTVFSKYSIRQATRHALPMLKESFLRRAFNLKRAVFEVHLPVEKSTDLVLLDTHLSAFSFGDGTLDKQVAKLLQLGMQLEKQGFPWVLSGDFNLLPPGDNPERLGKDAQYYSEKHNPIEILYKTFTPALTIEQYDKNRSKYNTYLPFGAKKTDRWIDHTFVGQKVKVLNYQPLQKYSNISDHLPIVIDITF